MGLLITYLRVNYSERVFFLKPTFGKNFSKAGRCDECGKHFAHDSKGDIIDPHWTYDVRLLCEPCCEKFVEKQVAFYESPA